MLILARRVNESIIITAGVVKVRVMITDFRRDGLVKLGIEAPPEVTVDRSEVHERRNNCEQRRVS